MGFMSGKEYLQGTAHTEQAMLFRHHWKLAYG